MDGSLQNSIFDGYYTKAQTAAEINKSEATLDRWHRRRVGPPRTKIGNTVLYRVESVRAWMIAQEEALPTRH